jgi:D-xylose transport system substrate-binding protein
MARPPRGAAVLGAAALLACVTACAPGTPEDGDGDGAPTIGVLMPDQQTERWESFDRPLIERYVEELCGECRVTAANAQNDEALQQQQIDTMITRGVDALILGSVDARANRSPVERAHSAGIPVVSYDRLTEGPVAGYVSFDNVEVGRLMGEAMLRALDERDEGRRVVMINGPVTDPNSGQVRRGATEALQGRADIARTYVTVRWDPVVSYSDTAGAVADLGPDRVDGVVAASDALAAGSIAALRAASIEPVPPVTGQDADLAAVQRIVDGDQYMTVYNPFPREARPAAEMAVALARDRSARDVATTEVANGTHDGIPAVLARPIPVTVDDIEEVLVEDGVYTTDEICTSDHRAGCERAGLT